MSEEATSKISLGWFSLQRHRSMCERQKVDAPELFEIVTCPVTRTGFVSSALLVYDVPVLEDLVACRSFRGLQRIATGHHFDNDQGDITWRANRPLPRRDVEYAPARMNIDHIRSMVVATSSTSSSSIW